MDDLVVQHGPIQGLYYVSNYIMDPDRLSENMMDVCSFEPITSAATSRRVAHFGYRYRYNRSGLSPAECIPSVLGKLVTPDVLKDITGSDYPSFNQVIVNEYHPSQGISPHVDHTSMFGPIIGGISLGAKCEMKFVNVASRSGVVVPLEIGSLFLLTGPARYRWTHALTNKTASTRYSITFRHVLSQ